MRTKGNALFSADEREVELGEEEEGREINEVEL